jgi:hypothetical protein
MFGRIVCAGVLGVSVFLAGGPVAGAAQRGSCSTSGLAVAGAHYKVVSLSASGIPCAKARSVAETVAGELAHGKPLALTGGVEGFAMNTTMCGGCKTTTQVALTYATGKITISLGGKPSASQAPGPFVPNPVGPVINA